MITKKILLSTTAATLVAFSVLGCNDDKVAAASKVETPAPAVKTLSTQAEKVGYTYGLQIGAQLSASKDLLDSDALMLGLQDALDGKPSKLSDEEMQLATMAFQQQVQERAAKKMSGVIEENRAFLAQNKTKEGVVTLPSGLQYKVVQAGTGTTPTATDTVVTHYTGTLINGQVFDSSVQRGEPATFPVNGVIAGWTEALQLMKVGAKWQLVIPADLAYGESGAGQMIAPNSTLIFDIELLEIKK
ncbi:MAG: FKBP-type peptidyl-prolyl cis-trans isomerase [Sulfurimonadaceae bacterium]